MGVPEPFFFLPKKKGGGNRLGPHPLLSLRLGLQPISPYMGDRCHQCPYLDIGGNFLLVCTKSSNTKRKTAKAPVTHTPTPMGDRHRYVRSVKIENGEVGVFADEYIADNSERNQEGLR